MKQYSLILFLSIAALFSQPNFAQVWSSYTCGNDVQDILADGDTLWVATTGGLAKINFQTLESEIFTKSNSGLPFNILQSLALDNNHNLWIGTRDHEGWYSGGLVKFDGNNWTVYNSNNSPLPIEDIRGLAVDQDNNVWIGTYFGGAARFDGTNWTIFDGYPWTFVQTVKVDNDNNVWMGTENAGLLKFDGTDWTIYNTGNSGIPSNRIQYVEFDHNGYLWAGTWGGYIFLFHGSYWIPYTGCFSNKVMSLAFESTDVLWAAPLAKGLARYDNQWTNYRAADTELPEDYINVVETDDYDNLWVGTGNFGLGKYQDSTWTPVNTSGSGLPGNWVKEIIPDWQGNTWCLTYHNGVSKFDGESIWEVFDSTNSVLPNSTADMARQGDSLLWFATWNGLVSYNNSEFSVFNTSNSNIPNDTINCLAIDNSGIIWMGMPSEGLVKYDGSNVAVYNPGNSPLPTKHLREIKTDSQNNIWIITASYDGLIRFDGQSFWDIYNTANSDLPVNDIRCLYIDDSDMIYAGTYTGGLAVFDGNDWEIINDSVAPFHSNYITAVVKNEEELWVGTRIGLYKYSNGDWTTFMVHNSGLPNKFILSLACDNENKTWIGMYEGGLAVYDPSQISGARPFNEIDQVLNFSLVANPIELGQAIQIECNNQLMADYFDIAIYSLTGRTLYRNKVSAKDSRLILPGVTDSRGIYLIEIFGNFNNRTVLKLIVN